MQVNVMIICMRNTNKNYTRINLTGEQGQSNLKTVKLNGP